MMKAVLLSLAAVLLLTAPETSHAWILPSRPTSRKLSLGATVSKEPTDSSEIQDDIERLRNEALHRLEEARQQMEDLQRVNEAASVSATTKDIAQELSYRTTKHEPVAVEPVETKKETTVKPPATSTESTQHEEEEHDELSKAPFSFLHPKQQQHHDDPLAQADFAAHHHDRTFNLLDDTRWKIAWNVGREPNTWMPAAWGASGERLLFQVVVDLSSQPAHDERDEFFQGVAGCKRLDVLEAWRVPTGVGLESRGRRPVAVKPKGAYKVVPGQGPMGTDILRLYIELEEPLQARPDSDVVCPAGRVYGTCGYFELHDSLHPIDVPQHAVKDRLAQEHREAMTKYNTLAYELEQDTRLVSLEKMKKMKEVYDAKEELQKVTDRLAAARQRDPERSQLRVSRDNEHVGLTKEGGVVCKVHKGLALEYHILGKMELASVKRDDHHEHDEVEAQAGEKQESRLKP